MNHGMENFAFTQFLGQIYHLRPDLQKYDDLVRQFLRDELKGKKSFVVQSSTVDKADAFVQKRLNVTTIGEEVLPTDAMLFAKVEFEESGEMNEEDVENIVKKLSLETLAQSEKSQSKFSFVSFLFGFVVGGLVVAGIFVYNSLFMCQL